MLPDPIEKEAFRLLEDHVAQLKRMAQNLPPETPEYIALKTACAALLYVVTKHPGDFLNFLNTMNSELTDQEKQALQRRGINLT